MLQRAIRNYEISVWSLQDDFITILKAAEIERKGQIEDGKLTLKVDGTQEFTFSIPMYIYKNNKLVENPTWYDYIHGILITNMRKIKVIINKGTEYEDIFEFIIIKVTERHETNQLYCDVECEGLAFHELGKTGYKISLSSEDFYNENNDWFNRVTKSDKKTLKVPTQPFATLNYWLNKFMKPYPTSGYIDPSTWYYSIEMDWSANTQYTGSNLIVRSSNKVYEDEYVSSWQLKGSTLVPSAVEGYKEKERLVDLEESNKYNLTQDLAENFGVYCKYIYEHDSTYHITGRKVVFYNNVLEEDKGPIDINYRYNTDSITREMDGIDLVTKMYVRPVDNDSETNYITIMDVEANKSREDYILNFDYMYKVGAIDEDTYSYIPVYETRMHEINNQLVPIEEQLANLQVKLPEEKAKLSMYSNAVKQDNERISSANNLLNNLTDGKGKIQITENNPDTAVLLDDTNPNYYYIKITKKGIDPSTVKIYLTMNYAAPSGERLQDPITIKNINTPDNMDDSGNLIKITKINIKDLKKRIVYLTYEYTPSLYYENIKKTWENRLANDEVALNEATAQVEYLNQTIISLQELYENILKEKQELIDDFEHLMGAALREGYWQPEDYTDYGDQYIDNFILNLNSLSTYTEDGKTYSYVKGKTKYASLIWDYELFTEEQDITYKIGAAEEKQYYPCIDLSNSEFLSAIADHLNVNVIKTDDDRKETAYLKQLGFLFYDYTPNTTNPYTDRMRRCFTLGSECELVFIQKDYDSIIPALILTGAKAMSDEEKEWLMRGRPALGILTTEVDSSNNLITKELIYAGQKTDGSIVVDDLPWVTLDDTYHVVYPRIRINSLKMKTSDDQLSLTYSNNTSSSETFYSLTNYEDFSILTKSSKPSYYITIKPIVLIAQGTLVDRQLDILYSISNADTAIYLDAIEVLKDSSQPQVSYTVNVTVIQKDYIKQIHKMLNRIVHINDVELKFQNVQGYVSEISLDLDRPWEDSIEIKNYKTKFEDLFTKIVASVEQMKKQEYVTGVLSQAFNSEGNLRANLIQNSLNSNDIKYYFNNGKLSISEKDGIIASSDTGVVSLKNNGLYCAVNKNTAESILKDESTDSEDSIKIYSKKILDSGMTHVTEPSSISSTSSETDWNWVPVITPNGINPLALMDGQLDLNKIRIYAGDQLRFQFNENGLYAYKTFLSDAIQFTDSNIYDNVKQKLISYSEDTVEEGVDALQYIVLNPEGLFLIAKEGARVLNKTKTDYIVIGENGYDIVPMNGEDGVKEIKRVELSWEGLSLHNYRNEKVFFADADTGDLTIKGTIKALAGWFGNERGWYINKGLVGENLGKIIYTNASGEEKIAKITNDDLGGVLYSANGKAIFTSGTDTTNPRIILSKKGFPNLTDETGLEDAIFLFDGQDLSIRGNITATGGIISGWMIGERYLGNRPTQLESTVGMASEKDESETEQKYSFWAGGAYGGIGENSPKFSVSPLGRMSATDADISGTINIRGAGRNIGKPIENINSINFYNSENQVTSILNTDGYTLSSYAVKDEDGNYKADNRAITFIAKNGEASLESFSLSSYIGLEEDGTVTSAETWIKTYGNFYLYSNYCTFLKAEDDLENIDVVLNAASGLSIYDSHCNFTLQLNNNGFTIKNDTTSGINITKDGIISSESWANLGLKTKTFTQVITDENGNMRLNLDTLHYVVLCAQIRAGTNSYICIPFNNRQDDEWYIHITTSKGVIADNLNLVEFIGSSSSEILHVHYYKIA